jgi:predicted HicB family RNase H-like nuclease
MERTVKLTVRLDPETHKTLRIVGIERGESVQVIVEKLVRQFLEKHTEKSRRPKRTR